MNILMITITILALFFGLPFLKAVYLIITGIRDTKVTPEQEAAHRAAIQAYRESKN